MRLTGGVFSAYLVVVAGLVLAACAGASAGTTGGLSGLVTDVQTHAPVAGANQDDDYRAVATLQGDTFDIGGQSYRILPGMRGRASIVVERRTIAEWILAPLFRMVRG